MNANLFYTLIVTMGSLAITLAVCGCEPKDKVSVVDWVDTRGWPEYPKLLAQEINADPYKEIRPGYYYLQSNLYWARPIWNELEKNDLELFQARAKFNDLTYAYVSQYHVIAYNQPGFVNQMLAQLDFASADHLEKEVRLRAGKCNRRDEIIRCDISVPIFLYDDERV